MITSPHTILLSSDQLKTINDSLQAIATTLHDQSFWSSQLFGTLVGAMIGLIPSIYLIWKDKAVIKVKVSSILVPTLSSSHIQTGISISIYNFGRRPIVAERVFLEFKDKETMIFMSNSNFIGGSSGLPKTLGEGSSHTVAILSADMAEIFRKKQCYPIFACYADALGNVYRSKTSKEFWDRMFRVDDKNS